MFLREFEGTFSLCILGHFAEQDKAVISFAIYWIVYAVLSSMVSIVITTSMSSWREALARFS